MGVERSARLEVMLLPFVKEASFVTVAEAKLIVQHPTSVYLVLYKHQSAVELRGLIVMLRFVQCVQVL